MNKVGCMCLWFCLTSGKKKYTLENAFTISVIIASESQLFLYLRRAGSLTAKVALKIISKFVLLSLLLVDRSTGRDVVGHNMRRVCLLVLSLTICDLKGRSSCFAHPEHYVFISRSCYFKRCRRGYNYCCQIAFVFVSLQLPLRLVS